MDRFHRADTVNAGDVLLDVDDGRLLHVEHELLEGEEAPAPRRSEEARPPRQRLLTVERFWEYVEYVRIDVLIKSATTMEISLSVPSSHMGIVAHREGRAGRVPLSIPSDTPSTPKTTLLKTASP
jgi:hypothetical protein